MQTNQAQTKTHSAQASAILAALEQKTAFNRKAEPIRSIDKVLQYEAQQAEARVIADAKLFTPSQVEALELVQTCLREMAILISMINNDNEVWKLGLPTMKDYYVGDMNGAVDDRVRVLHRTAEARGVNAVLDNKGGASQYKELKDRQAFLEALKEKTAAYVESQKIKKQKEAA